MRKLTYIALGILITTLTMIVLATYHGIQYHSKIDDKHVRGYVLEKHHSQMVACASLAIALVMLLSIVLSFA